jgi:hypothetical protein
MNGVPKTLGSVHHHASTGREQLLFCMESMRWLDIHGAQSLIFPSLHQ